MSYLDSLNPAQLTGKSSLLDVFSSTVHAEADGLVIAPQPPPIPEMLHSKSSPVPVQERQEY